MRQLVVAVLSVFAVSASPATNDVGPEPDTSKVLRVFTRFNMGHACPVAENLALTSAHVIDPEPFNQGASFLGGRYSSVDGSEVGLFETQGASNKADVAAVIVGGPVAFYPIAKDAPQIGERLWWVGYFMGTHKKAFEPRVLSGKVIQIVAGHIIIDERAWSGSSGGCVLNSSGEVVGLLMFGVSTADEGAAAGVVGVYGDWFNLEALKAELQKRAEGQ